MCELDAYTGPDSICILKIMFSTKSCPPSPAVGAGTCVTHSVNATTLSANRAARLRLNRLDLSNLPLHPLLG